MEQSQDIRFPGCTSPPEKSAPHTDTYIDAGGESTESDIWNHTLRWRAMHDKKNQMKKIYTIPIVHITCNGDHMQAFDTKPRIAWDESTDFNELCLLNKEHL